jgi:hypothetical protein
MKTILKLAIFALIFIFLLGIKGAKASEEFKKVIRKEFQVNSDALLTLNNKFGKIQITNWEKNEISIEVTITVNASDQESAGKKFSRFNIDFSSNASAVSAITAIEDSKSSGKGHFSVDYIVQAPATNSLDITNKFGDIFINEVQGKARIDLGYGNLEVRKMDNSDNLVEVKFGKARFNAIKGAVMTLKYSELNIDYAGSLRLNSKFSDLQAGKIIALNMVMEGGKLNMQKSSSIESRTKFTDIEIERLDQSLNLEIQYGKCEIEEIPADFSTIIVKNKFGDISLNISEQARYSLEAGMKFCELDYPESKAKFSYRSVASTEQSLKGIIGGGEGTPASKVTITSEFGDVSLH